MAPFAARAVPHLVSVVATAAATVLLTGLLVAGVPPTASAGPAEGSPAAFAAESRSATNHERTSRGRRPLAADACLTRHARRQAERMAAAGRLSHSPDLRRVARACGLRAWGENVARTLSTDDGRGVVGLWMDSPGHRRNLLDGSYRRVGHAAVRRGGGWWVVQLLGRRR